MKRRLPFRMGFALALLVPTLAGCQRLERAQECRSVWKLVNPTLREIDAERVAKPEDARSYEGIAARYMLLSGALAQLKVESKRLQDPVGDYQRLLQEASRDAHEFAEALKENNPTKLAFARAGGSRTVKREILAAAKLDATCRGK